MTKERTSIEAQFKTLKPPYRKSTMSSFSADSKMEQDNMCRFTGCWFDSREHCAHLHQGNVSTGLNNPHGKFFWFGQVHKLTDFQSARNQPSRSAARGTVQTLRTAAAPAVYVKSASSIACCRSTLTRKAMKILGRHGGIQSMFSL
jgi:hypothetical protein